jgi:hypothetical protein
MGTKADYGYGESRYLKAEDLVGKTYNVAIEHVEDVQFDRGVKPVIYFRGWKKGLVVNATNFDVLAAAIDGDSQKWVKHTVTLSGTKVPFSGKQVDSIKISVPKVSVRLVKEPTAADPELDDEIPDFAV